MLESIELQNFVCFDEHNYRIHLNKLNIIVGENNSGKSTLLNTINVMRIMTNGNPNPDWNSAYYQLHDLPNATYARDLSKQTSIVIEGRYEGKPFRWTITRKSGESQFAIRQCSLNGEGIGINSSISKDIARKIWYFSPTRNIIPFEQGISGAGDNLQPIRPNGNNINQFLLEQFTSRNPLYNEAEKWLKLIDPQMSILKTPLRNNVTSIETTRDDGKTSMDVNLSLQGSGIQNATTIICGLIFSPEESTIIIEEPENFLHPRSMEVIVDLMNHVVNNLNKQVILTTHSMDIINKYIRDVGPGRERTASHVKINPDNFKVLAFYKKTGEGKIIEKNLQEVGSYHDANSFFKELWG